MEKLYNNIINLCTAYQIEESVNRLDMLYLQLKIWKSKLSFLEDNKPFKFQIRKMAKYNQEKTEIETYINKIQDIINKEFKIMGQMLDDCSDNTKD